MVMGTFKKVYTCGKQIIDLALNIKALIQVIGRKTFLIIPCDWKIFFNLNISNAYCYRKEVFKISCHGRCRFIAFLFKSSSLEQWFEILYEVDVST